MSGVGTVKLLPKRRHFWLATLVAMFNPLIPLWITSGYLDCQMVVSPTQAMGQAADPPQSMSQATVSPQSASQAAQMPIST